MLRHKALISTVMIAACLFGRPISVQARGGHGGGGGGGGGIGGPGGRAAGPAPRSSGGYGGYRGAYPGHYARYGGRPWGYPHYGWGYPRYAWGYPYYGYGLGLGIGVGYGLSTGYGYGAYYGYPTYAYGVYDTPVVAYPVGPASPVASSTPTAEASSGSIVAASASSAVDETSRTSSHELIARGDSAFKAGNYDRAAYAWRHAIVDDAQNPLLVLKLGQALFALGKYEESAGAVQAAMRQLPKEQWGDVIAHNHDLYGKTQDYTKQLKALERALRQKPDDPALHFLAGYHYGYLGFHRQSIERFEKVVQLEPRDELAKQLRDEMKNRLALTEPASLVPPVPQPISQSGIRPID